LQQILFTPCLAPLLLSIPCYFFGGFFLDISLQATPAVDGCLPLRSQRWHLIVLKGYLAVANK
jgi:hypothetical protein